MAVPNTNVTFSSIQTTFGGSNPISMSEYYRGGSLVPSGTMTSPVDGVPITPVPVGSAPIRVGMFRGVSSVTNVNLTISANTSNYNIFTAAGSPSGPANVTVTVNSGIIVYGTGIQDAMTTGSGWASGSTITLVNNGIISGYAGNGGATNAGPNNGFAGITGGNAFSATVATNITNNGTIAAGGGGGGSGGFTIAGGTNAGGAGGAGGGGLTSVGTGNTGTSGVGGTGGAGGTAGTTAGAGAIRSGGNGGSVATNNNAGGGGGGSWGHPGGNGGTAGTATGGTGAKAGSAYTGSSNITWSTTGIRYGTVDGGNVGVLWGSYVRSLSNGTGASVSSGISFNTTGLINFASDSFSSLSSQSGMWVWYQPLTTGIGSSYWIRATLQSGTTPTTNAGLGTWLQLNANRLWQNDRAPASGIGSTTSTLLFEISTSATGTPVVASGSYTITATRV